MIDDALWVNAMALLDRRSAQCTKLLEIVQERDSYLEKALVLIRDRDAALASMHRNNMALAGLLKAIADNPDLLRRPEYQALIDKLPSTH